MQMYTVSFFVIVMALSGCASSYHIEGVVVEGPRPGVFIVDSNDARLKGTGVADARIQATLDADKLRPKPLPMTMTDDYGRFAIPVSDPGAGMLEYTFALYADAEGYGNEGTGTALPLPPPGKRVLVVMSGGRRKSPPRTPSDPKEDLIDEAEKFKRQFE